MMLELWFHPEVSEEVKSAYFWYQEQADGLGDDFIDELEETYRKIIDTPERWSFFQKGFRRCLLFRFPFSVIYRQHNDAVYVIAVMHNRRKPDYWLSRLS